MATSDEIRALKEHINSAWPQTIRRSDGEVADELTLPRPFTVPTPGATFRLFFYWDTFYTSVGLVRQGLMNYGYAAEAARIAQKYVDTVTRNFQATGQLWEKYNVVTGGVDASDEYPMPPMQGWTAGVFLYAAEVVETAQKQTGKWRKK